MEYNRLLFFKKKKDFFSQYMKMKSSRLEKNIKNRK